MTSTQVVEFINIIAPIVATNKQDMPEIFYRYKEHFKDFKT